PGVERAPTPAAAHARGTWQPRRGPDLAAGTGKPTVRKAQLPSGHRMTRKRMPVAERRQETGTSWLALRRPSRATGRIRAHARTRKGADGARGAPRPTPGSAKPR